MVSEQKSATCGERQRREESREGKKEGRKERRKGRKEREGRRKEGIGVVWDRSSFSVMSTHLPAHTHRQTQTQTLHAGRGTWRRVEEGKEKEEAAAGG